MADYQRITHGFGPYYDHGSTILILGSFPSVKSREQQFFYGHPMNRFWPMMASLFGKPVPRSIEEKKAFLEVSHIALYDVIEECDIKNSSDSSIRNVVVSDLLPILEGSQVRLVLLNGRKAGDLFLRYQLPKLGNRVDYAIMPSTSPANAATSMDQLLDAWGAQIHI